MDRLLPRQRFTARRRGVLILIATCAIGFIFLYFQLGNARELSVRRDSISIGIVKRGVFEEYLPISGTIEPRNTVYLDAIDGGQVVEVLVEEGAMVERGQPLVRLKNANLALQVLNSEAQLSEQLNRLAATRIQFEQSRLAHEREEVELSTQRKAAEQRLARLKVAGVASGAVRRADIEDAELEANRLKRLESVATRARIIDERMQKEDMVRVDQFVQALTTNLTLARSNLDSLVINAPISGQLTALDAHMGESKTAGQRVGQIDEIEHYKVEALVDEHYLPRVAIGQSATASTGEGQYALHVTKIYSEIRERQFKIDLDFDGKPPDSVRRGMSLQIRLSTGKPRPALLLTNGPFYQDTGGEWAFVFEDSSSRAIRRRVRFGHRTAEAVEVLDGLREGDKVITSRYETLQEFQRITIVDSK